MERAATKPSSVFIADDDDLVVEVLTRICKEFFSEVVVRSSGTEALSVIVSRDFDLIITDLRMPGESGLTLLGEARRRSPDRPLLLISGYADEDAIQRAQSLGAHVLHKPFGARSLRHALLELCPWLNGPS